ncbi:MAG: hypothetical protein ACLR8P_07545 [Clostridium fessum]
MPRALDAGEEKLSIINMEFASGDETNAEFHAQAIMEVESNPDTRMLTAETTIDLGTTTDDEGNEVENKKAISFPLSWTRTGKLHSQFSMCWMVMRLRNSTRRNRGSAASIS